MPPPGSGMLFDIKRFAIHDGPGIRTTAFFKGCPLSCDWCHNPESQTPSPELLFRSSRCTGCGHCVAVCPEGALRLENGVAVMDRERCAACGKCVPVCSREARSMVGEAWTAQDLAEELSRDTIFFEQSGGGITCSGGEPLAQAAFCADVLRLCRERGLHTAVDTCGHVDEASLRRVAEHVDLFLYDLKLMDGDRHRQATGVPNDEILHNLEQLDRWGRSVWIRVPLVPGVNDDEENLCALADFVRSLSCVRALQVLPYHAGGDEKWLGLGRTRVRQTPIESTLTPDAVNRAAQVLARRIEVPVTKGGGA
jgi:pyruvate formate lyase activating enzyme